MGQVVSVGFKVLINILFDQNNLVKIIPISPRRVMRRCVSGAECSFQLLSICGALWRATAEGFRISNWTPSFSTGKGSQLASSIMARLQLR